MPRAPMAMPTSAAGAHRRVVDAIAGHRHDVALCSERLDDPQLVRWEHPSAHVDAAQQGTELGRGKASQHVPGH